MGSSPTSGTASRTTVRELTNSGSPGRVRVRAQRGGHLTVLGVSTTSNLSAHRQHAATVRGYRVLSGSLATAALATRPEPAPARLVLLDAQSSTPPLAFPIDPVARLVDGSGRLKPCLEAGHVRDVLGWRSGVLDSVVIDGWLVLRQEARHEGAARGRNSHHAGFTVTDNGVERIGLRRGHLLALGAAPGTVLLLAALPEQRALVVVNPIELLSIAAPSHVRALFEPA